MSTRERDSRSAHAWSRARSLFEQAVELPEDERVAFLARECGDDDELRRNVAALLRGDATDGGMLDAPVDAAVGGLLDRVPAELFRPGAVVGSWRLIRELGHGGMGVVYLAERADRAYEQRAALKIVRGSLLSGTLEKRFLRERQILARLQHPGIARLLDGGFTGEGQPYFVMEWVEGEPITEWAGSRSLDVRQRLRLFLDVCDAVAYAHRQLVVHRDLKPANILVTAEGRTRLLDFGVARLLDDASGEAGLTRTGMLLLTPEYAAPEQVRGEPPSTATDVYGLGAVLYELLSGKRIRYFSSTALTDMLDAFESEVQPLAEHSDLSPQSRRQLRGDLQTIVHRAVANDRVRRYPDVEALAADVRRYLEYRPVLARPDTASYRLGKYVRRHRAGVAAAAAAFVLLALGVAGTLWQAREAQREADLAREMSAFLQDLFSSVDPEEARGREVSARELLDIGAARINELRADPEVRVDVLLTLGDLYSSLAVFDRAEALLAQAEREAIAAFGPNDARTARTQDALGYLLTDRNRFDEAEAVISRSLAASRRSDDPLALMHSLDSLAHLRSEQGRHAEARDLRREILALNAKLHGGTSWQTAASLQSLGVEEMDLGNHVEAGRLLAEALRLQREVLGSDHPSVSNTLEVIAVLLLRQGRPEEAEPYQRAALAIREQAFGEEHPEVAHSLDQIALSLDRQNRREEAIALYERALEMRRRTFGEKHVHVANTLTNLAAAEFRSGDLDGAVARQREALETYLSVFGDRHPLVANAMSNLGVMLRELGEPGEANGMLERSLAMRRELFGDEHTESAVPMLHLSILRRMTNRLEEAESFARRALAIFAARLPEDHPRVAEARVSLGAALLLSGRAGESGPLLELAYSTLRSRLEGDDLRVAESQLWLGTALARLSRDAEALPHLREAHASYLALRGPEYETTRQAEAELETLTRRMAVATVEGEQ